MITREHKTARLARLPLTRDQRGRVLVPNLVRVRVRVRVRVGVRVRVRP